jgi:hypothetical protein
MAIDSGTYRYAAPSPWANALADITVHNTLSIPSLPAARRGPRFLWLSWPQARIAEAHIEGDGVVLEMVNTSWNRAGIVHRRRCVVGDDHVRVTDDISVPESFVEPVKVHWQLTAEASLILECSAVHETTEVRGDERSARGWASLMYARKHDVRSVCLTSVPHHGRLRVVSTIARRHAREGDADSLGALEERSCST